MYSVTVHEKVINHVSLVKGGDAEPECAYKVAGAQHNREVKDEYPELSQNKVVIRLLRSSWGSIQRVMTILER